MKVFDWKVLLAVVAVGAGAGLAFAFWRTDAKEALSYLAAAAIFAVVGVVGYYTGEFAPAIVG